MKRWQWWAAGIIAYVVVLLAIAPATLLDAIAGRMSGGMFRVAAARGTIWSGSGELQLLDVNRQAAMSRKFTWRISPLSALAGRLDCEIALDSGATRFPLILTPGRIELTNADVTLPAAILGIAEPNLAPFEFGGELQLHVTELAIARARWDANATVVWRAASVGRGTMPPLGDYELRIAPVANGNEVQLRTLGGPLALEGSGTWPHGARPAFNATARVLPQYREQLEPLLRMIAYDRGAGNYELILR
jgi:general secretion pathway protein N